MAPKAARKQRGSSSSGKSSGPQCKTINFTVKRSSRACNQFLTEIRNAVTERRILDKGVTYMPARSVNDLKIVDLELRTKIHGITLRIQAHDCYTLGYRRHSNGKWYRFEMKWATAVMPKAELIKFGESYLEMGGLKKAKFGYPQLVAAINALDTSDDTNVLKQSFMNVCVFVLEASRFSMIGTLACNLMHAGASLIPPRLPLDLEDMINEWFSTTKYVVLELGIESFEGLPCTDVGAAWSQTATIGGSDTDDEERSEAVNLAAESSNLGKLSLLLSSAVSVTIEMEKEKKRKKDLENRQRGKSKEERIKDKE